MTANEILKVIDGVTARLRGRRTAISLICTSASLPFMQLLATLGFISEAQAITIGMGLVGLFSALAGAFKRISGTTTCRRKK